MHTLQKLCFPKDDHLKNASPGNTKLSYWVRQIQVYINIQAGPSVTECRIGTTNLGLATPNFAEHLQEPATLPSDRMRKVSIVSTSLPNRVSDQPLRQQPFTTNVSSQPL